MVQGCKTKIVHNSSLQFLLPVHNHRHAFQVIRNNDDGIDLSDNRGEGCFLTEALNLAGMNNNRNVLDKGSEKVLDK